tara:strand:+ start:11622 stop:14276 length:2655 start_codon:yes stop_codon:yes gene_type:complete
MRNAQPGAIYLRDYQPPAFTIERTELAFDLHEDHALVTACLHIRRNPAAPGGEPLELHGQQLELVSLAIDGRALSPDDYQLDDAGLRIRQVPDTFRLQSQCRIQPQNNTALEGLYKSRSMFCTQCEAEGFRKITWYLDRPDVMAVFDVTVEADATRYPVLLSNGNPLSLRPLGNGRHRAHWHDPFPKPAYLFALVAGDLRSVDDQFVTASGREVALHIYVEEKDLDKCDHAMLSLKQSMRWDEEVYGREYDLDIFNIVAVDDFNMGAMENKGLNIFNSACVLCSPEVTTDNEFQKVQAIVAHEYFHNWSGNRVTCRDWFQLSLKEGFTVFRDAAFSADMGSPTVKRVAEVNDLRNIQFAEDAGPLAHPVRPESYIEISNFYTATIYEKGAEVVRMIHTLLGAELFRAGSDLYFQRHDGQAVTCEDFVRAMEDASGVDLQQFRLWYSQAGTPLLSAEGVYDAKAQQFHLTLRQSCPPTPGQPVKAPLVIPVALGLLGSECNLPLRLATDDPASTATTHRVLVLNQAEQTFVFQEITEAPVPALLRGFSAPVRLDYVYSSDDLRALMSREEDGFVRWDAAQQYALRVIAQAQAAYTAGEAITVEAGYLDACGQLLQDPALDPALVAEMMTLPGERYLADLAAEEGGADVDAIHAARQAVRQGIATAHKEALQACYLRFENTVPYAPDAAQTGARRLRNLCLDYLALGSVEGLALAATQFREAANMTDRLAALQALAFHGRDDRSNAALQQFYRDWEHEPLVVNKWLQLQAMVPAPGTLERVQELVQHPAFELHNPNKVRALIGAFANANPVAFHRADGAGYRLLADKVTQLNALNPQLAARLLEPLTRWRKYRGRGEQMRAVLVELSGLPALSPDVFEVLQKSLED